MLGFNIYLRKYILPAVLFFSAIISASSLAQEQEQEQSEEGSAAKDDEGGGGNFLILPVFITEPAVGEGLGLGLVYFHAPPDPNLARISTPSELGRTGKRPNPPPTATGVFAFKTSNGTQGFGVGHSGSYLNDKIRVIGALASMEIRTTFYQNDTPFNFELDGELAYLSFKHKIGSSRWFFGVSTSYLDGIVDFDLSGSVTPPSVFDFSLRDIGLAASATLDSRDDTMMPGNGRMIDYTMWFYSESFGGDFDYSTYRLKVHSFHPLGERFVLGLRGDLWTSAGRPPFYGLPFVSLRGIPALRYQGETTGVFELEGRFNISPRWAAIAFGGTGFANSGGAGFTTDDDINAYGIGIRFQALKKQNVWLGLDIARGPEEDAWYVQMGHAW